MNQSMSKHISLILLSSISIFAAASLAAKSSQPAQNHTNQSVNPAQIKWLGISLGHLSPAMKSQLSAQLNNGTGVMVSGVQANSPAEKAGLKAFDVITRFNKTPVNHSQQMYHLIQQSKVGDTINIEYIRAGKKQKSKVKIGSRAINQPQNWYQPFQGWPNTHQFGGWPNVNSHFNNDPFWNSQPQWNQPFFQNFGNGFTSPFYNFPAMPSFPDFPKDFGNDLSNNNKNGSNIQTYSQSESLSMETLEDGKIHIELKSKDTNNDEKKFVFEGKRDQVIKDIQQQKDLPDTKKQKLIGTLQGSFSTFFNNSFNSSDFNSNLSPTLKDDSENKTAKRLNY